MSTIKEILVLHHSHLDVGYTHVQPVLWELQRAYIDQALDLCERTEDWPEDSKFRWTCEATAPVLKWLETSSDDQIARFQKYLSNGQMCITAMNMHTSPLCNAEQLARMLYPVRYLRERFGIALNTAINHDINGQPWALAQILLDAGIELYTTGINIHFGGIPLTRPLAFQWHSPDGRNLLSFHGEHYSMLTQMCQLWEKDLSKMRLGIDKYISRIESQDYPHDFVYISSTNAPFFDNTPPDEELAELFNRWNAEEHGPKIRFATPEMLLARLREIPEHLVPVHSGDWTDYWNFGAASSAAETRLNRRTKLSLQSAELLEAFQADQGEHYADLKAEAWDQANLYDEHTWGANVSIALPDSNFTAVQWMHKSHTAYQANSLSWYLLGKQLELFAKNPLQSGKPEGILLVNPTHTTQKLDLRIPGNYMHGGRNVSAGRLTTHWNNFDPNYVEDCFGTVEIPAYSWKMVPYASLEQAKADLEHAIKEKESVVCAETGGGQTRVKQIQSIESPYYTLEFDTVTGRIIDLYDKKLDWHLLDTTSEWTFFQFVHESIDPLRAAQSRVSLFPRDVEKGNNSISCWNNAWPASRVGANKFIQYKVDSHASGTTLQLEWDAPGVDRLVQTITLLNNRPAIDLRVELRKQDVRTPESIYFAFPLNLQKWTAKFDSAGVFVELDRDQLPGSCRDWVTVDRTVSVYEDSRGVTLACPDAPLVQIGDFNFGKEQKSIPRQDQPILLAWPINNYWDTNFRAAQPGLLHFKYELSTFSRFDPNEAIACGINAINPIQMFPAVNCQTESSGAFIRIEGEDVVPSHIKKAEDGRGIIVRLQNIADKQTNTRIAIPDKTVSRAFSCSILEENLQPLEVDNGFALIPLKPFQLQTVRIEL